MYLAMAGGSTASSTSLTMSPLQRLGHFLKPNKNLISLKLTIFFYGCSAFCILPYLTLHMQDIGISVKNIAIMYSVMPFTSFVSSPIIGFLADKLGNYNRVLIVTLLGDAIFFGVLLAVPQFQVESVTPETQMAFYNKSIASIQYFAHDGINCKADGHQIFDEVWLHNCTWECDDDLFEPCEVFDTFLDFDCVSNTSTSVNLINMSYSFDLQHFLNHDGDQLQLSTGCHDMVCHQTGLIQCTKKTGNPGITNGLYFPLRCVAMVFLAANFILIDAQTITMCKKEAERSGTGDTEGALGPNYTFMALAQLIISPIVGKLMDMVTSAQLSLTTKYLVPFLGNAIFIVLTIITVCKSSLELDLPKAQGLKGLGKILTDVDIMVFLFMQFVLGNCWGFIETFLFIYLKDDMNAPMYLLGLTMTVGAVVSIPFLFISDWMCDKIGRINVFILALFIYGVRYIGYAFISNPWMSFPFEALEVFTNTLMRIAAIKFVGEAAPKGLLATLNGMFGGIHYGFGKGTGSLIGGALIVATGSTSSAFRWFGYASVFFGIVYLVYEYCIARFVRKTKPKGDEEIQDKDEERSQELQTFVAEGHEVTQH